jgi:hypothetical protein
MPPKAEPRCCDSWGFIPTFPELTSARASEPTCRFGAPEIVRARGGDVVNMRIVASAPGTATTERPLALPL